MANLDNKPLVWLWTHCSAIGMDCKSDSGELEHDISLFTIKQQERIAELERRLLRATVLATKHCPREHHDWAEIVSFYAPKGTELVEDILRARVDGLKNDLAAAQATIQQMREALIPALRNIPKGPSSLRFQMEEALALPADRTALDAMMADAEKRGVLKAAGICDEINSGIQFSDAGFCAGAIRQAAERSGECPAPRL